MSILDLINECEDKKTNMNLKAILPKFKLVPMNKSQNEVLKEVEKNTLTTVIGAAGCGKTSVITAIASHFILTGRKVLVVSKSDHAIDVVTNKLNNLGCGQIAIRGGKYEAQVGLSSYILDLIENKVNLELKKDEKSNIIKYLLNQNTNEAKKLLRTKRVNDLKYLLSDSENRKNLIVQAKSCLTKRINQREKIKKTINFKPILEAMPCFCVTSNEVSSLIPLQKELFDLLVYDESSECDIASFIPNAYRAKKAVVVGDDKQLRSLNMLEQKKNKSFMTKYEVPSDLELIWDYTKNSLFSFTQFYSQKCILLDEQYRMPENVFKFNNDTFYNGMIKSAKKADENALKKVFVNGVTDTNKTINYSEAEAIIKELKNFLKKNKNNNKTIAILSMFRQQVDLITKLVQEFIPYNEIEKHNITITTANGSQGMEWDCCLLSWCIDNNCKHQSKTFACNPERLNVITSRCREQIINYYSTTNLGDCLLGRYLSCIPE